MKLLSSVFKFKCPNCREGDLFHCNNPYKLRHLNKMHKRCSNCNLKFSIEPGFFQGAAYVSYGLQVINCLVVFIFFYWLTPLDWKIIMYFIMAFLVILTPFVVVLSRAIWLYMFVPYKSFKN